MFGEALPSIGLEAYGTTYEVEQVHKMLGYSFVAVCVSYVSDEVLPYIVSVSA